MIIGDSNNRNAFEEWYNVETMLSQKEVSQNRRVVLRKPKDSVNNNTDCDPRWSDQEMILLTESSNNDDTSASDSSCHIVSLKFSKNQDASIQRLVDNIHDTEDCHDNNDNNHSSTMLPQKWQRPHHPNLIWFSTGFWELQNQQGTTCEKRFERVTNALDHWQQHKARIIWQSLFPINSHPEINNAMIEWDYKCQKKVATRHGIQVADLYSTVQLAGVQKAVDTFHLTRYERFLLRPLLDACCGGWEDYLGANLNHSNDNVSSDSGSSSAVFFDGRCRRFVDMVRENKKSFLTRDQSATCCDQMRSCIHL